MTLGLAIPLWPNFTLKHAHTYISIVLLFAPSEPSSTGSPGICGAEPACISAAGPCPALGQCLVAPEPGERAACAARDGRTGMSPGRRGDTTARSRPAVLSQLELAPCYRHGLRKKIRQHPQESSHRQRPGRPRGPWEDKGRKRERGERDKQFPTQLWLEPILQETHGP